MGRKPLEEQCPTCFADLQASEIPGTDPVRHYSRLIGVEIPSVYDGVLYYECPFCTDRFHRFRDGTDLWRKADPFVRKLPTETIQRILDNQRKKHKVQLSDDLTLVNVHDPSLCEGQNCAIHGPSQHPLNKMPRTFHAGVVFRVCSHGVEHPDPDSIAWLQRSTGDATVPLIAATHTCCGARCCREADIDG
jgi:hypothetical protein